MKKLIMLLMFFPLFSYAQLTSGVYNIVKQKSIVEGQEMFETDLVATPIGNLEDITLMNHTKYLLMELKSKIIIFLC